ncbi:MAG: spore cortex biosynthesis protein YabQ [Hungatella sp.]
MSENIHYETRLLLMSFATGMGLTMTYDLLRIWRLVCPHRSIWVGLEDVLYWIYTALMLFTLLYSENDGILRAYIIVFVLVGMLLYQRIISRNLLKHLKKGLKYLRMKRRRH